MSANEPMTNPAQVVITACADALVTVGAMGEHVRQVTMNREAGDLDAAALHKRAAVQKAKVIRKLLTAAFGQVEGFIEAMDDEKPRIQRV